MPENAVYVGRPSKWGNPYRIGSNIPTLFVHDGHHVVWRTPRADGALDLARAEAVVRFRRWQYLDTGRWLREAARSELHGKDLVCWCPLDQPCHADVLLELAR